MILVFLALFLAIYFYGTRTFNYWKLKNVTHDKPIFLIGNNLTSYLLEHNITQQSENVYWKYPNERVVGFYRAWRPELVIRDPDIVKRVLIKDFTYFHKRGISTHEKVEPLLRNLFFVDGDLWRLLRHRITPAFTTSKLKAMFPFLHKSMEQLNKRIGSTAANDVSVFDAHELMARFTTDFVCASLFNVDAAALSDEASPFRKIGRQIFELELRDLAVLILKEIMPKISGSLKTFNSSIEKCFMSLIESILKTRQHSASDKVDLMDLLLESYRKGFIEGTSIDDSDKNGSPKKIVEPMDKELMAAQAFIFFAAGYETSASITSFILLQLAYHPLVQKEVHEELDRVFLKYNNTPTYEAFNEMKYLKCVLNEGLRMFPPVGFISRKCTREYTFPDLNLTIDKGVVIVIPVKAIQNDPKYFKDPSVFRPERFFEDSSEIVNKYTFLPFGEGPRSCVGNRMGMLQSAMGLAAVLSEFTVEPTLETKRNPEVNPTSNLVQIFKEGPYLQFRRRKHYIPL